MSELLLFVGGYFLPQLFYGGMIWILICLFVFTLGTESRTKWLKELWSWFEDKSYLWHLVFAYAIGWAYMLFYY